MRIDSLEYMLPVLIVVIAVFSCIMIAIAVHRYRKRFQQGLNDSLGRKPNITDIPLDSIQSYHQYILQFTQPENLIDEVTWNDLEVDLLFRRVNACLSSVGEEYLYHVMHEPQFNKDSLQKREQLISFFESHPEVRILVQTYLAKLGKADYNRIAYFIFNATAKRLRFPDLYKVLSVLPIVFAVALFINLPVGLIGLAGSIFVNGILCFTHKSTLEAELSAIRYFSSILFCCNQITKIDHSGLKELINPLRESFAVFRSLRGKASAMMQRRMADVDFFADYMNVLFLNDIRKYNKIIEMFLQHQEEFHNLYKSVGEIDLAICLLSFRKSLPFFCIPHFKKENSIRFSDLYHPLIENPVCNSGMISTNSLITGSNASGKSTFIKSLAVNNILAQTINTCSAREYTLRFSLTMTSMAIRDNIAGGNSYFITEIKSLKRILDKIQSIPCTCFVDEILRGTNTIERIAASASVLKYLQKENCLCIVASHDIELTEILKNQYDQYHFREQLTDDGMFFEYKLQNGPSQTKNAIRLLSFLEYNPEIVQEAESMVDHFLKTRKW